MKITSATNNVSGNSGTLSKFACTKKGNLKHLKGNSVESGRLRISETWL